jgi:hypothetical protein
LPISSDSTSTNKIKTNLILMDDIEIKYTYRKIYDLNIDEYEK